jgi:hypothetical protein|tara:strand:- start:5 stop:1624 length:1620 start_codon:yes stop_codon:yes gene_type:complete
MASIIRVKRSTGTSAPSSLQFGEVGVTLSGGGTQGNSGDRLFVGDNGGNPQVVGGRYFTDLLSNTAGSVASAANASTAANGFVAIVDQNRKVDQWNVDNLRLDANVLSSTNTDGDIFFTPNGAGEVVIGDDIKLAFGDSKDAKIEYDEDGDDRINVTGADWVYENGVAVVMADVTDSSTKDTGALIVEGGVGIEKSVNIGGNLGVTGVSTFTGIVTTTGDLFVGGDLHVADDIFFDEATMRNLKVTGVSTFQSDIHQTGGVFHALDARVGGVGISSNVISSLPNTGNTLFIDPYPDGLSNEGQVIIKGDLQVDGTTTTVDSFTVNLNDPIINLGVTTSTRTVMQTANAGVSTIKIDTAAGINTGDGISGTNVASGTTISTFDLGEKLITLSNAVQVGGIATTTQLEVTSNVDTNTDRGVAFNYNTSAGSGNNKVGFFGYIDTDSNTNSNAPARSFTYIPDATLTGDTASGTRGSLDIKNIYFQSGDFDTTGNGIVYFDTTGRQIGAAGTAAGITTSNFVLTTNAAGIPKWTTTLDGGTF